MKKLSAIARTVFSVEYILIATLLAILALASLQIA